MKEHNVKILYFITEDWYFWSHRLAIARAALKAGMSVSIVCQVKEYEDRIRNEGFNLIPITINRSGKNLFAELFLFVTLLKIYRRIRPDIVHHVAMKPTLYGSWAAQLIGVPYIVNAVAGLGHLFVSRSLKDTVLRFFVKKGLYLALQPKNVRVIFQNRDDLSLMVDSGFVANVQTSIIKGSGVDVEIFQPADEKPSGVPIVILLSRMLMTKGVGEFVEASRILKNKKVEVRMVLVGEPDPVNPASIPLEVIIQWQEEGIIEYWGRRGDVPSVLRQCSVSVLPSYREGLPKSLVESAAAALPLVAFDVPGCREIVRHGINGFLVPFKNVEAFAGAIERLVEQPLLRKDMGEKSRQIVVEEFTQDHVVDQTMNLYKNLLRERGGSQNFAW